MDIKCINNRPLDANNPLHPDIKEGNIYFVIGMEGEYFRIIGDLGLPYLYHKDRFEMVHSEHEPDWSVIARNSGLVVVYPPEMAEEGFFARFFNGDTAARDAVYGYIQKVQDRRTDLVYNQDLVNTLLEKQYDIYQGKEGKYVVLHTYDNLGKRIRDKVQGIIERFHRK